MKKWIIIFGISVCVHVIPFLLFQYPLVFMDEESRLIELRLIPKVSKSHSSAQITSDKTTNQNTYKEISKYSYLQRNIKIPACNHQFRDHMVTDHNLSAWDSYVNNRLMEEIFLPPRAVISDSVKKFAYLLPDLNVEYEPGHGDDVGAALFSQQTGGGIKASSISPPDMKPEIIDPQFNFIPTPLQVAILSILFQKPRSAPGEIYPLISDTLSTSIQTVFKELDFLYQKGMINRKKISANSPLNFFGIPLEFNSKNRRNINYIYWAKIVKNDFLNYLNSDLCIHPENVKQDSIDTKKIESLRRQLIF